MTPTDRGRFENASEDELEGLFARTRFSVFRVTRKDRTFKARKIASQIELDEGAVSTAFSRLKDRGLVEHKARYLGHA